MSAPVATTTSGTAPAAARAVRLGHRSRAAILLASVIGNMRKISHENHRKIVVFYKHYNADMRKLQAPRHKVVRRKGVFLRRLL